MTAEMIKVVIVTVGTEITDGEILNRNATQLAQWLTELGFMVVAHIVVGDRDSDIQMSLKSAESLAQHVVITGGLGPTSDDITRASLARHLQIDLELEDSAWQRVQDKLQQRGVTVRAGHRWQCEFPKGSVIYQNSAGTADGFAVHAHGRHFWVLPGPPIEIDSIWYEGGMKLALREHTAGSAWHLWALRCLGIPETEVEARLEAEFAPERGQIELGYRAHSPFVTAKLWIKNQHHLSDYKERMRRVLGAHVIGEGSESATELLLKSLEQSQARLGFELHIWDAVTQGALMSNWTLRRSILQSSWQYYAVPALATESIKASVSKASATHPTLTLTVDKKSAAQGGSHAVSSFLEFTLQYRDLPLQKLQHSVRADLNWKTARARDMTVELAAHYWWELLKSVPEFTE